MRTALVVLGLAALALPAHADPDPAVTPVVKPSATPSPAPAAPSASKDVGAVHPYRRTDRSRLIQVGLIVGMGSAYLITELRFKDTLVPDTCRWCAPTSLDRAVRNALVWDNPGRADRLSTFTGYVAPAVAGAGLLLAASWSYHDNRRRFDDIAPVLESAIGVGLFNEVIKLVVGRARPLVRFGPPDRAPTNDDNLSFFSGHTSLAFAAAVSSGVIAHRRHYRLEPVIWATGLTLATATGYLRIAADKHYLTDVIGGAIVGTGFGYLVPRVFHQFMLERGTVVVPTAHGAAVSWRF